MKSANAWQRPAEECASLCQASLYRFDPDIQYLRVRGAGSLTPLGLAIVRELTIWRDAAARVENVPPRTMLRDEILVDLSRSPVTTLEKLGRVRGLPRPVENAHGQSIVDAVNRAISLPESAQPSPRETEQSPTERFRADALWAKAQMICYDQQIDPALVSSRQEVGEFLRAASTGAPMKAHHLLTGWRKNVCGEMLLNEIPRLPAPSGPGRG
jgi:ribonuclease D